MNFSCDCPLVGRAMRKVTRDRFLPAQWRNRAEEDRPLPIACGQTTSQPSLIAYMIEQLGLTPKSRVLEVGTGSGYLTAILAEIVASVYTIELVPELADGAQALLTEMGYRNIHFRTGDGTHGWPEAAPFDAIIVSAAGRQLPTDLVSQLAPGGRLVVPVGDPAGEQTLVQIEMNGDGEWVRRDLCCVWFVPLVSASVGDLEGSFEERPKPAKSSV